MAARVHDPEGAGFEPRELALLKALPQLTAESADAGLASLREHFDEGEVGQIVHAHGMYRGLHGVLAVIGAEILDGDGRPLSEREGFGVVTRADGSFLARDDVEL